MSGTHRPAHRWQHVPGQELLLLAEDLAIVRYHFATDRNKAFVHPLCTSTGTLMTWAEPPDHFWHHGLWFAWKYLNGVNYWEEQPEDRGSTELTRTEQIELLEDSAVVRTTYRYRPAAAKSVLTEQRAVVIHCPDGAGQIRLDWCQTFSANDIPVTIDRTPINNETPWGGYAGLSWRAAPSLHNLQVIDSQGRLDHAVQHQRARWADLSGAIDGDSTRVAGITMFDHPDNPRHPTHWKCFNDPGFGYLNPAFVLAEPYTVMKGDPLTLRYRVLVHQGWAEGNECEREFRSFASAPPPLPAR